MANNFSALMPSFYVGLNKVQQEQTDLIDSVNTNAALEQAVIGQTITYPIAPVATLQNTVYSGLPTPTDSTAGTGTLSLSLSKSVVFAYNGEEIQQLQLGGIYSNYYADQIAQSVRAIRKAVSTSIQTAGVAGACRAIGTAGSTPFASADLTDFAAANKVMNDNGSPDSDRHLILNTAAVANIQGKVTNLYKANEAGTDRLLRTGSIGTVEGFQVGMDTQLATVSTFGNGTAGHNVGALVVGQTAIVTDTTGTPIAGDTFTIATDSSHTYVVQSWTPGSKTVTIPAPGIMQAVADNQAITFGSTAFKPNLFFTRDAIQLIARQPLLPYSGPQGQLLDLTTLPDPRSGLTYQLAMWQNGRQQVIETALVWGTAVVNSQDLGLLLG
jgi:hypothetical protein